MDAGRRETFSTVWEGTEGPVWVGAKSKGKNHGYLAFLEGERPAAWGMLTCENLPRTFPLWTAQDEEGYG